MRLLPGSWERATPSKRAYPLVALSASMICVTTTRRTMSASTIVQRLIVLVCTLLLAACAGTIQRESGAGARRVQGASYKGVEIVLNDEARRAQGDNPLFNARELGDYVRKQLDAHELLNAQGTHRVEVTIEHMRVRSAAAAML